MNLDKLERQLKRADDAIRQVLTAPHDAEIWADEDFWSRRWPAMCDRSGELVDQIVAEERKARA